MGRRKSTNSQYGIDQKPFWWISKYWELNLLIVLNISVWKTPTIDISYSLLTLPSNIKLAFFLNLGTIFSCGPSHLNQSTLQVVSYFLITLGVTHKSKLNYPIKTKPHSIGVWGSVFSYTKWGGRGRRPPPPSLRERQSWIPGSKIMVLQLSLFL